MAIAALVLGIIAVVFAFIPGLNLVAIVIGIVGIILAVVARKQEKSSSATAGLVLSIIGLALGVLTWIACTICAAGVQKAMDQPEVRKAFEQINKQTQEAAKTLEDAAKKADKLKK